MKYNRSEIMRRAWEIKRSENVSISEALKAAWAEAKNPTPKTLREEMIERINTIISASNRPEDYTLTAVVNDWANYGKNRTYISIVETRANSRHYAKREYGYIDNLTNAYVPGKCDARQNYTFSGAKFN
jgi:hypothetical protein